jgi:hypothetical protein
MTDREQGGERKCEIVDLFGRFSRQAQRTEPESLQIETVHPNGGALDPRPPSPSTTLGPSRGLDGKTVFMSV